MLIYLSLTVYYPINAFCNLVPPISELLDYHFKLFVKVEKFLIFYNFWAPC